MPLNNPIPGPGSVTEYMAAAIPWITASTVAGSTTVGHQMPCVASMFAVRNMMTGSTDQLAVGFTAAGVEGANRSLLGPGEQVGADFRFKSIFLRAVNSSDVNYELIVGLTTIPAAMFPTLTGSGVG